MQEQDIKRGHFKDLDDGGLKALVSDVFGDHAEENGVLVVNFGALDPLRVWIKDRSTLCVDTTMNTDVDEETAILTRKRYNEFLERATGFTSKQRRDRLQKKAKDGSL